jgi:hypothetical protein
VTAVGDLWLVPELDSITKKRFGGACGEPPQPTVAALHYDSGQLCRNKIRVVVDCLHATS